MARTHYYDPVQPLEQYFGIGSGLATNINRNVQRIEIDGKRWYMSDDGIKAPSVTTILGSLPNEGLERWRKRVGEKEAERISFLGRERGKQLHDSIEAYLTNQTHFPPGITTETQKLFRQVEPELRKISQIQMIETQMICPTHAGTPDCIGHYDGVCSIIDFKSSKRRLYADSIEKYFMQCYAYLKLWEARYPRWNFEIPYPYVPKQFVLIVSRDHLPDCEVHTLNFGINQPCANIAGFEEVKNNWDHAMTKFWNKNA